jgi:hypothetical protein
MRLRQLHLGLSEEEFRFRDVVQYFRRGSTDNGAHDLLSLAKILAFLIPSSLLFIQLPRSGGLSSLKWIVRP